MSECEICGKKSPLISRTLNLCGECAQKPESIPISLAVHSRVRREFGFPEKAPSGEGIPCFLCQNSCRIDEGGISLCGVRKNERGKIRGASAFWGNLSYYYDPLPTNCVADWVCPGGTGAGYPRFAYKNGPEYGFKNLAVFYRACSFDCLFCQNWHYRYGLVEPSHVHVKDLAQAVDERTSCICFFGGDPTPQLPHALLTSRLALRGRKGRILRICFETNGSMNPKILLRMAELSLETGGCIKFDLKTYSENLHFALCGVSNRRTLENFALLARMSRLRPDLPLLIASTLLIPGYVDGEEVEKIASFIASLNPDIPYSLLAFYPQFRMEDLPTTSRRQAEEAMEAAKKAGLRNVHLGNVHLLGELDYGE
ncbi:MAG: radical SAM protein [Coprothermobacterota bacterium]|nr:radical SAM protein [Coprothermobacterota bacterium]